MISHHDRTILRDLAKNVAEVAAQPVMDTRRDLWRRHNDLESVRPLVLVFPEGSWRELLPDSALSCAGDTAREMERNLRMRTYYPDHLHDDTVIESNWVVQKRIQSSGWGVEAERIQSPEETGSWGFAPVINKPNDLDRIEMPRISYDHDGTMADLALAHDLFGDILDVELRGVAHISFHFMARYTAWRGLEQVMWDMYDEPEMLHRAMSLLEQGYVGMIRQYQALGLLSRNDNDTYNSSGGIGYTDQLPAEGYDGQNLRLCDLWAFAEDQELAQVSPQMHAEFIIPYVRRVLAPFGLTGYGCCEDLTDKIEDVLTIPNLRRISISPWADVDRCAEKLGNKAIYSWKPNPAHLVGAWDEAHVRDYIQHTVDVAGDNCVLEIILKDTHTCEHRPERFTAWTDIARSIVEQYAVYRGPGGALWRDYRPIYPYGIIRTEQERRGPLTHGRERSVEQIHPAPTAKEMPWQWPRRPKSTPTRSAWTRCAPPRSLRPRKSKRSLARWTMMIGP